jgi:hypothetical protein
MPHEVKKDPPKRISRWENLQRVKAPGRNHPDPVFRMLMKAFEEAKQNEEQENREQLGAKPPES